jgi:hypothetical protein
VEEQKAAAVVVKPGLDELALAAYIAEQQISHEQIIAIAEPEKGKYTLIFEGTPEQHRAYRARLDKEAENMKRVAEAFGKSGGLQAQPIRWG